MWKKLDYFCLQSMIKITTRGWFKGLKRCFKGTDMIYLDHLNSLVKLKLYLHNTEHTEMAQTAEDQFMYYCKELGLLSAVI